MPTLLGRLMARSTADLASLAKIWGARLPGRGHAEDVTLLYRAMTDTWALRDIVEGLSPPAARLLWSAARDGSLTPDGLAETTRAAALEELATKGLLHPAADEAPLLERGLVLADETGALCRRLAEERRLGDRSRLALPALLEGLDAGDLGAAADAWGLDYAPGSQQRSEIIGRLLELSNAPRQLSALLARLEPVERTIYDMVWRHEHGLPLAEIRRRLGLTPSALRRAVRHLHAALLVWESWVERERRLFVPRELCPSARPSGRPLAPISAEPLAWRHPYALAWDLLALLRAEEGRAGSDATPTLSPSYPLWHAATGAGRPAYLSFLRSARAALGLDDLPSIEHWSARPLAEQQAALVAAWRAAAGEWSQVQPATSAAAAGLPEFKERCLGVLRGLDLDAWYEARALAQVAARAWSTTLAPAARASAGRHRSPAYRRAQALGPATEQALRLLQNDLVWLGILEAGRDPSSRAPALRLTAAGAGQFELGSRPPATAAAVVVEPSLRLLVYAVDAPFLWSLLGFATPEHLDHVSLFRLTRAGILDGLARGLTGDTIVETLTRSARGEVPQNVLYAIRDWARPSPPVHLSRALILTFPDEQTRDRAAALAELKALGAEALPGPRLSLPTTDAATESKARAVLQALRLTISP